MEKHIKTLISEFLVHLGIDFADLNVEKNSDGEFWVNITSEEPNLLIGHHGENLQAMQKIITVIAHHQFGEEINLFFDVDNYRKRQEENVISITEQKIEEVRNSRAEQVLLPPMSPYFRRVVHLHVRDGNFADIETESIGQGNYRQVVIKKKA